MVILNEKGGMCAKELLHRLSQWSVSRRKKKSIWIYFNFGVKFLRKKCKWYSVKLIQLSFATSIIEPLTYSYYRALGQLGFNIKNAIKAHVQIL